MRVRRVFLRGGEKKGVHKEVSECEYLPTGEKNQTNKGPERNCLGKGTGGYPERKKQSLTSCKEAIGSKRGRLSPGVLRNERQSIHTAPMGGVKKKKNKSYLRSGGCSKGGKDLG